MVAQSPQKSGPPKEVVNALRTKDGDPYSEGPSLRPTIFAKKLQRPKTSSVAIDAPRSRPVTNRFGLTHATRMLHDRCTAARAGVRTSLLLARPQQHSMRMRPLKSGGYLRNHPFAMATSAPAL